MSGSRALSAKSSSLPSLLSSCSPHSSRFNPLRRIPKRTVRMASSDTADPPPSSKTDSSSTATAISSAASAIDFLTLCHRLKTTKRTGWVRRDVRDPESVADHMYRMGVMALVGADLPGVDRDRCIKMAIVHDIAEAIVGDITPSDGVSKLEKSRREKEALDYMCKLLGGGSGAKEIGELWMEYEENSSLEAKVVKDFDKAQILDQKVEHESSYTRLFHIYVEMILQALEYETEQGLNLNEFFESTAGKFQTDVGKAWASEIASRRKKEKSSSA